MVSKKQAKRKAQALPLLVHRSNSHVQMSLQGSDEFARQFMSEPFRVSFLHDKSRCYFIHEDALKESSLYFKTLINSSFQSREQREKTVNLDVSPRITSGFGMVVEYMYLGQYQPPELKDRAELSVLHVQVFAIVDNLLMPGLQKDALFSLTRELAHRESWDFALTHHRAPVSLTAVLELLRIAYDIDGSKLNVADSPQSEPPSSAESPCDKDSGATRDSDGNMDTKMSYASSDQIPVEIETDTGPITTSAELPLRALQLLIISFVASWHEEYRETQRFRKFITRRRQIVEDLLMALSNGPKLERKT